MKVELKSNRRIFLRRMTTGIGVMAVPSFLFQCTNDNLNPEIGLLFPNGEEVFQAFETIEIIWDTEFINLIDLYFSIDGGNRWELVEAGIDAQQQQYIWTLPAIGADQCFFRINQSGNPKIYAQNTLGFIISPPDLEVALVTPNGGEFFTSGSLIDIRWETIGVGNVTIEYSRNNGEQWVVVGENIPAENNSLQWEAPGFTSAISRIRIIDADTGALLALSENVFTIAKPAFISIEGIGSLQEIGKPYFTFVLGGEDVRIIRLDDNTFEVMSLSCTHYGCKVNWVEDREFFECPCHNAFFTEEGCVINGPTSIPLPKYRNTFDRSENVLTIFFDLKEGGNC